MASWLNQRRKRSPTDHQKRIRFFIGLFLFLIGLLTIGLLLLINWEQLFTH